MALFDQYTAPGVYTTEIVANPGTTLQSGLNIPIFIGEGSETFLIQNSELHRGSSASSDDAVVSEDLSAQVTGSTAVFQLGYWPVVTGNNTGTITNNVQYVTVTDNGVPVVVSSLNGATGVVTLLIAPAAGDQLSATYYFKRSDTLFTDVLSDQVPSYASLAIPANSLTTGTASPLTLTLDQPGYLGNQVSIAVTVATSGSGVTDYAAITGSGTDAISIEARNSADNSIRSWAAIAALISNLGNIPTLNAGNVTVKSLTAAYSNTPAYFVTATLMTGGAGPASNTVFKVNHIPIVDGTNGGVVTNSPTHVTAYVNNVKVSISAVNGLQGLVTLTNPVPSGNTLSISYFTNTYQDTYDLLPSTNVVAINQVGLGPNRADFINGVDYVLENVLDGNGNIVQQQIQWGNSASTTVATSTPGYVPFNATVIATTLVDEQMFLQVCSAPTPAPLPPGLNTTFVLPDMPTDGSGQNKGLGPATDDPSLIQVYVGTPSVPNDEESALASALASGPVTVIQLSGATQTFKLLIPPTAGQMVFATYTRNTIQEATYTLTVDTPGITGVGTYSITDQYNNELPTFAFDDSAAVLNVSGTQVSDGNFYVSGIIWPYQSNDGGEYSDMKGVPGVTAPGELLINFIADLTPAHVVSSGAPATATVEGLVFTATTPSNVANNITISFVAGVDVIDADAVTVNGSAITVNISGPSSTRTKTGISGLFTSGISVTIGPYTTSITCSSTSDSTVATPAPAVNFAGGSTGVTIPVSQTYTVNYLSSPLAPPQYLGTGYLNQTFSSPAFGLTFTLINPADAITMGFVDAPTPVYYYAVNDQIGFIISASSFTTSAEPQIAILGLWTTVTTTYGMNPGDTATISTHNRAGTEPNVGDYYYVSYTTQKTAADMALQLFTNPQDAYTAYGDPTPLNRLSLAASLFTQNGGQVFGCIQVPKLAGSNFASSNTYISAIASLASPIPGTNKKADMIQVLTTNPTVIQYLNRFLITQAAPRNSGEAVSVYGYGFNDTPDTMRSLATSLVSDRMIGIAVPGAILTVTTNGAAVQYAVDGSFLAAAMAGMMLNPAIDVATTLTKQSMIGFNSLITRYPDPTQDLMAAAGLTCLYETSGALVVRHWVTTDNTSVLKREPTSRLIVDETRQLVRAQLQQFIGRKLVQSALNAVTIVVTATLNSLVENQILNAFAGLSVTPDASDPTLLHVAFSIQPIFSILYIDVEITVTTQL